MVLFLSENDVTELLSMPHAVDIVEAAFRQQGEGSAMLLPRVSQMLPGTAGAFRMLSAALPSSSIFGLKTLTGLPGKRLENEVYFVVLLFDMFSGALRAIISANHLTGVRTGAASGVAARYLANPQASSLGVIGSGAQAWYQVEALQAVCNVETVSVYSPNLERADAFAQRVQQELKLSAKVVSEPSEAVREADLVIAATTALQAVVLGEWLKPGAHVTAVGANTRTKRELDVECFRRGRLIVDSQEQVLTETGDVLDASAAGVFTDSFPVTELSEVVVGRAMGRRSPDEITLFKSVGIALQDVAVGAYLLREAEQKNVGTWLDPHALKPHFVHGG